jgi:glycosylphosphatidylinositol deacylase
MPFGTALSAFTKHTLFPLLGLLTLGSLVQSILLGTHLTFSEALYASDPGHALRTSIPPSWIANMLLGNQSPFFALLAAFVVFALVAAVMLEYFVLHALVAGAAELVRWAHLRGPASMRSMLP